MVDASGLLFRTVLVIWGNVFLLLAGIISGMFEFVLVVVIFLKF